MLDYERESYNFSLYQACESILLVGKHYYPAKLYPPSPFMASRSVLESASASKDGKGFTVPSRICKHHRQSDLVLVNTAEYTAIAEIQHVTADQVSQIK